MKTLLAALMLMLFTANASATTTVNQEACKGVVVTKEEAYGFGNVLGALTVTIGENNLAEKYDAYVFERWKKLDTNKLLGAYRTGIQSLVKSSRAASTSCLEISKLEAAAMGFIYSSMTEFLTTTGAIDKVSQHTTLTHQANAILVLNKLQKYMW